MASRAVPSRAVTARSGPTTSRAIPRSLADEPSRRRLPADATAPACTCDPALADALTQTWRRWRRLIASEIRPLGLTPAQARALRAVTSAGPLRMAELAAELDVVPRSATSMVDALADAGLVSRHADPTDRRSVKVAATVTGKGLVGRLDDARRRAAEALFAQIQPPEREQLLRLLRSVADGPVQTVAGGATRASAPTPSAPGTSS